MVIIYGYDFYPKSKTETVIKKSGLALYNTFQLYGLKDVGIPVSFIRSYYGKDEKFSKSIIDGIVVYDMPVTFNDYFEPNGQFDPKICYALYHKSINLNNPVYSSLCKNLKKVIDSTNDPKIIINTHNFIPTIVACLLKQLLPEKDISIFATIHDIDHELAVFVKENQNQINKVIAISDSVKERLLHLGFNMNLMQLIPNGIDIEKINNRLDFVLRNNKWDNICQRNHIDKSSFILTLPGRRVPHKGHLVAFKSLKHLLKSNKLNILLLISGHNMGKASYLDELINTTLKLKIENNVIFLDEINAEEMLAIYHNSDIVITPSTQEEGFCYANIECMLVGKAPIITSNFGGVLDYIEHEKTGILFPVNDDIALSQAINLLINNQDLRNSIAKNAKLAASKYNVKNMINSYKNLFMI